MKKLLAMTLAAVMLASTLCGCSSKNADNFYGNSSNDSSADITSEYSLDIPDYREDIEVGNYTGIEYYINEDLYKITDDMVFNYICSDLKIKLSDVTGRGAKYGDTITVTFTGTIDGEEFEGNSLENHQTVLGEGKLTLDFEEKLVGMKAGETSTIEYTFPKEYSDTSVAGKTAEFEVTLNKLQTYNENDITDDLVSEKTSFKTVSEYKAAVRESLENSASLQLRTDKGAIILGEISKNVTVKNYDADRIKELKEAAISNTAAMAKNLNMTEEDYVVKYLGSESYDEYVKSLDEVAQEYLKSLMIISTIAYNEDLNVTDEEYQAQIQEYLETYGVTELELSAYYTGEDIVFSLLMVKIYDWLIDKSVLLDAPKTES